MVQRGKSFTRHLFAVILVGVLLAGFGGVANGANAIRVQGNVINIDAQRTRFEICSDTECRKVDVSKNTSFMDVNGRASAFANLVVDDYVTVTGSVRGEDNGNGHDKVVSHQSTVDADVVKIGFKISYLILNGVVWGVPDATAGSFDVMDLTTGTVTCVSVPQNAEILLVTSTGSTTAILLTDLSSRQSVELHGHYSDTTTCFVAQTILATAP